jgi:hypothetical protein
MPRTTITPVNLSGGTAAGVGFQVFTWTAGDASNNNQFVSTGKEILFCRNVNADSPTISRILTLQKVNGKIEITIAAGEYWCSGQIPTSGFQQTDNNVYADPAHADLELAVLVLP